MAHYATVPIMPSTYSNKNRVGVYKVEVTPLEVWRHQAGLTRLALSQMLGVHCTTVRRWCFGISLPTLAAAFRIATVTQGAVPFEAWASLELCRSALAEMAAATSHE